MGLSSLIVHSILMLVTVLIGCIAGKITEKALKRLLHEAEINTIFRRITGTRVRVAELCGSTSKWFVYLITLIVVLKQLGIETIVLTIFLSAVFLFFLIASLLAVRDAFPNAVAGIIIFKQGQLHKGAFIKMKDVEGRVEKISLLQTVLKTAEGDSIYVPNASLVRSFFLKKKH